MSLKVAQRLLHRPRPLNPQRGYPAFVDCLESLCRAVFVVAPQVFYRAVVVDVEVVGYLVGAFVGDFLNDFQLDPFHVAHVRRLV